MSRRRVLWLGALAAVLLAGGWLVWRAVSPGVAASLLRPDDPATVALGLTVPGMPVGSPGMDGPVYGGRRDKYDTLLVRRDGSTSVLKQHS